MKRAIVHIHGLGGGRFWVDTGVILAVRIPDRVGDATIFLAGGATVNLARESALKMLDILERDASQQYPEGPCRD